jgi:DNA-binding CsgD family transcriptional regulator
MTDRRGLVVFGDVTDSRVESARASAWLRTLTLELDRHYGRQRLAPFGFTQGDELQGVLSTDSDPTQAVLRAALHPRAMAMRWVVVGGPIDAGKGPATQRTGRAFLEARALLEVARRRRDDLVVRSGDRGADGLLDDVAPTLAALLGDLTPRQRTIGRLLLVEGLRQADAAKRLSVSRPTVSVAVERAHVREIERLTHAVRTLLAAGLEAAADGRNGR